MTEIVANRDEQISNLTQIVADRDEQISNLTQIVNNREIQNLFCRLFRPLKLRGHQKARETKKDTT